MKLDLFIAAIVFLMALLLIAYGCSRIWDMPFSTISAIFEGCGLVVLLIVFGASKLE